MNMKLTHEKFGAPYLQKLLLKVFGALQFRAQRTFGTTIWATLTIPSGQNLTDSAGNPRDGSCWLRKSTRKFGL